LAIEKLEMIMTFDAAARHAGDVQPVINNAGVLRAAALFSADAIVAWEFETDVNVKGLIRMAQAFPRSSPGTEVERSHSSIPLHHCEASPISPRTAPPRQQPIPLGRPSAICSASEAPSW
jgi:NAD(P)-dependent dehydrogenase (short-subunit alcohol dehydrogenase family)